MSKEAFLKELAALINDVPKKEFDEIMNYYQETIDDRLEEGMSEEEAIATLESAVTIAKQIHGESISMTPPPAPLSNNQLARGLRKIILVFASPFIFTAILLVMTWGLLMGCLLLIPAVCLIGFGACSVVAVVLFPIFLFVNIAKAFLILGLGLLCAGLSIYLKDVCIWGFAKLQTHVNLLYNKTCDTLKKGWASI